MSVRKIWSFYWIKVSQLRFVFVFFFMDNPIRGNIHTLHFSCIMLYIYIYMHTNVCISVNES